MERFLELSLFYRLFSPLDSEMICIFPYFCPCEESAREIREFFIKHCSLKRFSFIGDGLSHVAFGAMAVASVLNFTNNMIFILPVTVICAVLLLRIGQNTKIKGDAAIAMISVGALSAMCVYKTFFRVTIYSVVLSVFCAVIGILLSILAGTPVGSTIVAIDIVAFMISCAVGKVAGGRA